MTALPGQPDKPEHPEQFKRPEQPEQRPGRPEGPGRGREPHDDTRDDSRDDTRDENRYEDHDRREGEYDDRREGRNENHDQYDGQEGDDGMDALMAAVLDVPLAGLSEEARADPAYLAAHRSATADVALLREQLGVLADVLSEPVREPERVPAPVPVRRLHPPRRARPLALRLAGVAAAGALVLGGGWVVVQIGQGVANVESDKSADSAAGSDEKADASAGDGGSLLGDPGYLACARLVVEGDVTAVARVAGAARERVTLHVTHAYRPAGTAPEVDFVMEADMDPLLREGDHVLVALSKGSATPDVWAVGEPDIAPEREALARALPETEGVTCE
ncbi:hypothetical protein [Streptomyces sp. Root1310]|uniref:hypothetical protein n=1 Tax=Streptomyces sp. Root1310 TaxID=1736452 RepID=UPI00070DA0A1|nr:hypothetical protein [Streptomyces sp. Root1310]KQX82645.1 hypothetical protein ASD48_05130 [Streptomyces sp. Root1310]